MRGGKCTDIESRLASSFHSWSKTVRGETFFLHWKSMWVHPYYQHSSLNDEWGIDSLLKAGGPASGSFKQKEGLMHSLISNWTDEQETVPLTCYKTESSPVEINGAAGEKCSSNGRLSHVSPFTSLLLSYTLPHCHQRGRPNKGYVCREKLSSSLQIRLPRDNLVLQSASFIRAHFDIWDVKLVKYSDSVQ